MDNFCELVVLSSPEYYKVFGSKTEAIMRFLFPHKENLYSYEHALIAEIDEKTAGFILSYNWRKKQRQNLRTGIMILRRIDFSFIRKLPFLIKHSSVLGTVHPGEHYIGNLAVYPEYRGSGTGSVLVSKMEEKARVEKAAKIALDTDQSNSGAVEFYRRRGYNVTDEFTIELDGRKKYYRMTKRL